MTPKECFEHYKDALCDIAIMESNIEILDYLAHRDDIIWMTLAMISNAERASLFMQGKGDYEQKLTLLTCSMFAVLTSNRFTAAKEKILKVAPKLPACVIANTLDMLEEAKNVKLTEVPPERHEEAKEMIASATNALTVMEVLLEVKDEIH